MDDLVTLEAIKRVKYRYLRCLDLKLWAELAECFTEDAESSYGGGKYAFSGRDKIMEFLIGALGRPSMITSHRVHHPEIELGGPDTAHGSWALEDLVIDTEHQITIRGAAFYSDRYVRRDGVWRIRSTGYERIYEELESRKDRPGLRLTANRWAGD